MGINWKWKWVFFARQDSEPVSAVFDAMYRPPLTSKRLIAVSLNGFDYSLDPARHRFKTKPIWISTFKNIQSTRNPFHLRQQIPFYDHGFPIEPHIERARRESNHFPERTEHPQREGLRSISIGPPTRWLFGFTWSSCSTVRPQNSTHSCLIPIVVGQR